MILPLESTFVQMLVVHTRRTVGAPITRATIRVSVSIIPLADQIAKPTMIARSVRAVLSTLVVVMDAFIQVVMLAISLMSVCPRTRLQNCSKLRGRGLQSVVEHSRRGLS